MRSSFRFLAALAATAFLPSIASAQAIQADPNNGAHKIEIRASQAGPTLVNNVQSLPINGQTIHGGSLFLDGGLGNAIFLSPPTSGGNQTFNLPSAGGTIATLTDLANYLPLAGGTMTGDIALGNHNITGGLAISAATFNGALNGNATTASSVSGTVAIANGGTGQTTASAALTALLPTQSVGTNGQVLASNGATASWQSAGGFSPSYLQAASNSNNVIVANGANVQLSNFLSSGISGVGSTFTINATGTYNVEFSLEVLGAGHYPFAISVNGATSIFTTFDFWGNVTTHYNKLMALNAGDVIGIVNLSGATVQLYTFQQSPAFLSITRIQ